MKLIARKARGKATNGRERKQWIKKAFLLVVIWFLLHTLLITVDGLI